jgi:membrane-bound inhibitor of C-type lysozyme
MKKPAFGITALLLVAALSACTATFTPHGEVRAGITAGVVTRPVAVRPVSPQAIVVEPVRRSARPDRMDVASNRNLRYRCNKGNLDVQYLNDFSIVEIRHDGRWNRLTYTGSEYRNGTYTWTVRAHGKNATLAQNGRTILQGCNTQG